MKWDCTMRKWTALPLNNIGLPHYEPYLWLISHTKVCGAFIFNVFKEWPMPPHARPVHLEPILHPWHDRCSLKMVELYRRCVAMDRMSDGVEWMNLEPSKKTSALKTWSKCNKNNLLDGWDEKWVKLDELPTGLHHHTCVCVFCVRWSKCGLINKFTKKYIHVNTAVNKHMSGVYIHIQYIYCIYD